MKGLSLCLKFRSLVCLKKTFFYNISECIFILNKSLEHLVHLINLEIIMLSFELEDENLGFTTTKRENV